MARLRFRYDYFSHMVTTELFPSYISSAGISLHLGAICASPTVCAPGKLREIKEPPLQSRQIYTEKPAGRTQLTLIEKEILIAKALLGPRLRTKKRLFLAASLGSRGRQSTLIQIHPGHRH